MEKNLIMNEWIRSSKLEGFNLISKPAVSRYLLAEQMKNPDFKAHKLIAEFGLSIIPALERAGISLIPPAAIGCQRGKIFEDYVEDLIRLNINDHDDVKVYTQVRESHDQFPEFLRKDSNDIKVEIPDIVIRSKNYNAIIQVQIDLWNGGAQSNRGEKYHSITDGSLYGKCKSNGWNFHTVVWAIPKISKSRASDIIKKGYVNGILLYPSTLIDLIRGL